MVLDRATAALACVLASTACSWVTVARPPQGPVEKDEILTCTTSMAAPVTDTVLSVIGIGGGGTALVSGILGASQCDAATCFILAPGGIVLAAAGALVLGAGVMEAFSAAYGYRETSRCRDLGQAQLACVSGVEPSCDQLRSRSGPPSM
jgi:hypothetical protein